MKTLKYIKGSFGIGYESPGSCGLDLPCDIEGEISIEPGEILEIGTGIRVEIPEGYFGLVVPRSSTGVRRRLRLINTVGIIDSDYRGEIKIILENFGREASLIKAGDRLCQMIIIPYERVKIKEEDLLSESDRGEGAFGSTGR